MNTRELVVYGGIAPLGDVDASGKTDVADVLFLLRAILNQNADPLWDTNFDGDINLLDVVQASKACIQ